MLVVDGHALVPVDFLDFIDEVAREVLLALGAQDVMQFGAALGERIAGVDVVSVARRDVLAAGHQVFLGFADFRCDNETALALGFAAVGNRAGDFRNNGHVFRLADFEEFGNARKTTGDILRLGGFAGTAGDDVTGVDHVAVLDHDDGADGQVEDGVRGAVAALQDLAGCGIHDGDGGPVVCGPELHDGQRGLAGHVIDLFLDRLAVDDVSEADLAAFLADEGLVVGIPRGEDIALAHFLSVLHHEVGTGRNVLALDFTVLRVDDAHLAAAAEHQFLAFVLRTEWMR